MKLVGLSGALAGSKTAKVVHDILICAKDIQPDIQTELVDLKDYDIDFVRGTPLQYYNKDTIEVVNKLLFADLLVIGTPIYQASITGALKNVLDHLPMNAFKEKVAGIVTLGGSDKHFLVAEHQLKPILTFLKATVPVGNVFVHNDLFDENKEISNPDYYRRIKKLAEEMVFLQNSLTNR
ncbi:NAD(P)H-dependent oxidoreductase [Paenibacillus sp. GSMTC-2017]|uniref:NADPH-dependent FMN reductase n=1 Tax=Paenibacillus sp. GSMTC-2017 TaxID=2794350 RepID=UPI0018D84CB4|nr:NAD(P)H-dependent oxidoreductase [Paenibacillus sp. GSMTC-2017]MBH5319335.1 NAD(P)H-dependent oxidoreductase [Paenibacillus sp. GSMTC-2017]